MDDGSAKTIGQGAACNMQQPSHTEWFCCWDTLEALARDADALSAKCGGKCTIAELSEWRERILAQIRMVLADEEKIFETLKREAEQPTEVSMMMDSAA